jgi:hypothetical protein
MFHHLARSGIRVDFTTLLDIGPGTYMRDFLYGLVLLAHRVRHSTIKSNQSIIEDGYARPILAPLSRRAHLAPPSQRLLYQHLLFNRRRAMQVRYRNLIAFGKFISLFVISCCR